jgi:hypothetical protein
MTSPEGPLTGPQTVAIALDDVVVLVDHDLVHVLFGVEREPQLQSAGLALAIRNGGPRGQLA